MQNVFRLTPNRSLLIANQNVFLTPIKHPSRTLTEHVISYVAKGSWCLTVGNEHITAKSDTVFIQPSNIPHVGLRNCPPGTHTLFVHFSAEEGDAYVDMLYGETAKPFAQSQTAVGGENAACIGTLVDCGNSPIVKNLFLKIIEEQTKGNRAKALLYLNILFCELSELSLYDKSKYALAANIKKRIAASSNKNISNKEIAHELHVSVRNAETAFRECFGITIHRYQLNKKIEHAKFCLAYYPQMKLTDIALSLGFYDEFHFSRRFKKVVGLSPTEYRKKAIVDC